MKPSAYRPLLASTLTILWSQSLAATARLPVKARAATISAAPSINLVSPAFQAMGTSRWHRQGLQAEESLVRSMIAAPVVPAIAAPVVPAIAAPVVPAIAAPVAPVQDEGGPGAVDRLEQTVGRMASAQGAHAGELSAELFDGSIQKPSAGDGVSAGPAAAELEKRALSNLEGKQLRIRSENFKDYHYLVRFEFARDPMFPEVTPVRATLSKVVQRPGPDGAIEQQVVDLAFPSVKVRAGRELRANEGSLDLALSFTALSSNGPDYVETISLRVPLSEDATRAGGRGVGQYAHEAYYQANGYHDADETGAVVYLLEQAGRSEIEPGNPAAPASQPRPAPANPVVQPADPVAHALKSLDGKSIELKSEEFDGYRYQIRFHSAPDPKSTGKFVLVARVLRVLPDRLVELRYSQSIVRSGKALYSDADGTIRLDLAFLFETQLPDYEDHLSFQLVLGRSPGEGTRGVGRYARVGFYLANGYKDVDEDGTVAFLIGNTAP